MGCVTFRSPCISQLQENLRSKRTYKTYRCVQNVTFLLQAETTSCSKALNAQNYFDWQFIWEILLF
jgi:hypothetical protein